MMCRMAFRWTLKSLSVDGHVTLHSHDASYELKNQVTTNTQLLLHSPIMNGSLTATDPMSSHTTKLSTCNWSCLEKTDSRWSLTAIPTWKSRDQCVALLSDVGEQGVQWM